MAIFGVLVENQTNTRKLIKDTKKRMNNPDMKRNPFKDSYLRTFKKGNYLLIIFNLIPLYPNLIIIACLFLILAAFGIYQSWAWGFIIGFLVASLLIFTNSLMQTNRFFYFSWKLALNKIGYHGTVQYLDSAESLRFILKNGSIRNTKFFEKEKVKRA